MAELLRMEGITKQFGAVYANKDINHDIIEPIKFLREREIVHYQRFSEAIAITQETYEGKCNFYAYNPAFDKGRRM